MSFFTMPLRKNWLITQKPLFMMLAVIPAGGHAAYIEWAGRGAACGRSLAAAAAHLCI